jgi:hypothetical protein
MEYVIEKEKDMLASPTLEQYLARQNTVVESSLSN